MTRSLTPAVSLPSGRPAPPASPAMVLDLHVHAAGLGYGGSGCFVNARMRNSWKFRAYLNGYGVRIADIRRQGDGVLMAAIARQVSASSLVDGAVVLAMDGAVGPDGRLDRETTEFFVPNEFVAAGTADYPHLYYGASIHPRRPDAIERLQQAAIGGAVLVKWIPPVVGIDPSASAFTDFYRELVRLDIPLLTHTGDERSLTRSDDRLGDPYRLALPLSLGVRVIAAHMGAAGTRCGQENMTRLQDMMRRHPNLYGDISSLTQVNKRGRLQQSLGDDTARSRMLYGTDFPLINTPLCWPPLQFPHVDMKRLMEIAGIGNPWDRDVRLKQAMGVPPAVFTRASMMLGIDKRVDPAAAP